MQPSASAFLEAERTQGLTSSDYYREFGARVDGIRRDLRELLGALKAEGKSIAAYGAAAKGSTLLNYAGIDGR